VRLASIDGVMLSGTLWCQDDLAGSSGSWPSATVDDLAADAAAAVAALRSQPMVDQNAVCLFGHSEGGWVALRCAVLARPRWLIVNSCPAVSFFDAEVDALSVAGVDIDRARAVFERLRAAARAGAALATAQGLSGDSETRRGPRRSVDPDVGALR
jgi:uncharacterized protein